MADTDRPPPPPGQLERHFWVGVARAFGGAIVFSLPMFMTMEMWSLGFIMDRGRLALMLLLGVPLLVGLSHYIGFEDTFGWLDDLVDSFVAYAVGFVASGIILLVFGVVRPGMAPDEVAGKVALQALAGALGAMLAQNQFGQSTHNPPAERNIKSYGGELFIMAVGSLFLAFNVAPTEEMVLIAHRLSPAMALALAGLSLALMHGFVYAMRFAGEERRLPEGTPWWSLFLRYTVAGYAVALSMSLYALWTFGRLDGLALEPATVAAIVLGFPSAMGAAAARLIL